jgi:uncharacterized protein YbjT (DUF2867 family)
MRAFLTGASGNIGGAGAVKLVNAGAVVRGLVRDPGKAEALGATTGFSGDFASKQLR